MKSRMPAVAVAVTWLVVVGLAAVAFVELVRLWSTPDLALGDLALIEIETRRTLSSEPPTLGAYSRYGWRHPGPVLFHVLALPYWLLGSGVRALHTGALVVNALAMAGIVMLMRLRGTAAVAAIGGGLLMMVSALGADGIADAWNVSITLVPLMLLVVACWSALCGAPWAVPVVAATYLFVFEAHVGVGIVATPVVVLTALVVAVDAERRRQVTSSRSAVYAAVACVIALGSPVLVDVVRRPPGNLGRWMRWSITNDEPTTGWNAAARLLGRTSSASFPFEPQPPRFLLSATTDELGVLPGLLVVLLIVALFVARRTARRDEAWLCAVVLTCWASALLAARSIIAPPAWWLVEWLQPLGWVTVAAIALTAWRVMPDPIRRTAAARRGGVALLVGLIVFATVTAIETSDQRADRRIEAVAPVIQLADAAESVAVGEAGVWLQLDGPDFTAEVMLAGVVNELDSRGTRVCLGPELAYKFPATMICSGDGLIRLILRSEPTVESAPPGTAVVTIYDSLPADVRARADASRAAIAEALVADNLSQMVGLLDTALAADVLLESASPAVAALADEVLWLDAVRERPGHRYGLYLAGSH